MADSLILYEIVMASFASLTALLFCIRRKYYHVRPAKKYTDTKTRINWMKSTL
jgi:hypothetical protein